MHKSEYPCTVANPMLLLLQEKGVVVLSFYLSALCNLKTILEMGSVQK